MKIKSNLELIKDLPLSLLLSFSILSWSCNKDVSVTPPDNPPPNGYVFVDSYPAGFHILLDGKERRRATPDSLTWLTTGKYNLTLTKDLFRDTSLTIEVTEGKRTSLNIDFSKNPNMLGSIYCESNPGNAMIYINDKFTGYYTPATLKGILPGNYEIRFHLDKYQDDSAYVQVSSGNLSQTAIMLVDTTLWRSYNTINSAIPTNDLTCVAVMNNGSVWAGTEQFGAVEFGNNMWQEFSSGNSLLQSNAINCISFDNSGTVFIGSDRGFLTKNGAASDIFTYKTSLLPDFFVEAIGADNHGNWYIGTHAGLTKTYLSNGSRVWEDVTVVPVDVVTSILVSSTGNIWAGLKNSGIAELTVSGRWNYFRNAGAKIISDNVTALAEAPNGYIWAGFDKNSVFGNGVSYFDGSTWHNIYPIPTHSRVNAILIARNNTKWIATDEGLITFNDPSNVTSYTYDKTGLVLNNITGLAEDANGNIWISTIGGGLVEYKGK